MRIYVNGNLDSSEARPNAGNIVPNDKGLYIGQDAIDDEYFHGIIDEVVIFNRALSLEEIHDLMKGIGASVEPSGKLSTTLGKIKTGGKNHISRIPLKSPKGFLCR